MVAERRGKQAFNVDWRERAFVLGGLLIGLALLMVVGMQVARAQTLELMTVVPLTFSLVGKFLPLWGITGQSTFGPYQLSVLIWALDTTTVLIFVYSIDVFYRVRFFRRYLEKMHHNMQLLLRVYPTLSRLAAIGVTYQWRQLRNRAWCYARPRSCQQIQHQGVSAWQQFLR